MLDEAMFWALISRLDWRQTGDDKAVIAPVVEALARLEVRDIEQFATILAEKLHALDTEAHAREIGESAFGGPEDRFSLDQFLYARCCVVANGRRFFEAVLADPARMPKDMDFEAVLSIADQAYRDKTGEEPDFDTPLSFETFSNEAGWPDGPHWR